ncbi:MAG TPA: hypothetical protein VFV87_14095 [Pirellulaceae bacterium]|nr:hypothetical protein [Pirellulaceae bacterium]
MSSKPHADDRQFAPGATAATIPPVGWPRLLLLLVLFNAPLFFNGCEFQDAKFTLGAAVPFAEFQDKLLWFSWPLMLVNGLGILAILWLATRRVSWINRAAHSRWLVGALVAIALLFDSWLIWPPLWAHAVFGPQVQIAGLIAKTFEGPQGASESAVRWAWLISARLYYVACVLLLGASVLGVRAFLRRYFFVRADSRWQIQLGGLMIVVVVLGTLIGLVVRLIVHS